MVSVKEKVIIYTTVNRVNHLISQNPLNGFTQCFLSVQEARVFSEIRDQSGSFISFPEARVCSGTGFTNMPCISRIVVHATKVPVSIYTLQFEIL